MRLLSRAVRYGCGRALTVLEGVNVAEHTDSFFLNAAAMRRRVVTTHVRRSECTLPTIPRHEPTTSADDERPGEAEPERETVADPGTALPPDIAEKQAEQPAASNVETRGSAA